MPNAQMTNCATSSESCVTLTADNNVIRACSGLVPSMDLIVDNVCKSFRVNHVSCQQMRIPASVGIPIKLIKVCCCDSDNCNTGGPSSSGNGGGNTGSGSGNGGGSGSGNGSKHGNSPKIAFALILSAFLAYLM